MPQDSVKLKKDYVIPAGTEFKIYSKIGPIESRQAIFDSRADGLEPVTRFSLHYVKDNPDMFEIISLKNTEAHEANTHSPAE